MREKKKVKISLGTVICIIIIFILLCVIGGMWYNHHNNNDKNTIVTGGVILNNTQNTKNKLIEQNNVNEANNTSNSNLKTKQEIIDMVKELAGKTEKSKIIHELRVRNIEKSEDKFLISADYSKPVEITEEQYERLKENKDFDEIIGFDGEYKKTSEVFGESEHGFIVIPSQEAEINNEYEIVKTDIGYSFVSPVGPGYPMTTAGSIIQFYLDESDIIYVENNGEKTLKEYAEVLEGKLLGTTIPIVTVNYEDGKLYLFESSK